MMNISGPTVTTTAWNRGSRRVPHLPKKSIDDAIDEYAQQLLQRMAGNDYIDDSLGSYVTSCIRSSIGSNESTAEMHTAINVVELPEYEPLCELIQEHCQEMDVSLITVLLQKILNAIAHRLIPEEEPITSSSHPPVHSEAQDDVAVRLLPHVISPYAVSALLPENLLHEEEDAMYRNLHYPEETGSLPYISPTLITSPPPSFSQRPDINETVTREPSTTCYDPSLPLAQAELESFPTKNNNRTIQETAATNVLDPAMRRQKQLAYQVLLDQQRLEYQVTDRLYRAGGISLAAATAAAQLARGNGPVAQYILHQAAAQVPVCRHLLTDGCYRADCTFSHDIENHTCVFWMKSQCAKGDCRFLHGFSESLLDQMPDEYRTLEVDDDDEDEWEDDAYDHWVQIPSSQNSFANIASQGYHQKQSFHDPHPPPPRSRPMKPPTVPIPQHLWQPHRDASAFGIADPLERYYAVASTWKERRMSNVMDLHYQSLQTFPVVLAALLPEQLSTDDGVWIVTGTGHHVAERGHQKRNVSTLEGAVWEYLLYHYPEGYRIAQGRDRNGQGGAIFIQKL